MKFIVDISTVVEAEDIAKAFKLGIERPIDGKAVTIHAASIRPHYSVEFPEDFDAPEAEQDDEDETPAPEEKAETKKPAAKKKPGRKKKVVAKKAEPKPEPKPEPKAEEPEEADGDEEPEITTVSKEALVEAARQYMSQHGAVKTRELLREFDAQQLREVDEARWPEVYAKLMEGLQG